MLTNKLEGKQLLLIAPLFFGYYKEIISEANKIGITVDYICDAPSNSNISKALGRINKNLIKVHTVWYFQNKVLPLLNNQYDYVFLIACMNLAFSPDMIGEIRESIPHAKFILYQWDAEKNFPSPNKIHKYHKYFDKIYTFDRFDSRKRSIYKHLPLFYTTTYEAIADVDPCGNETEYDCAYIGTAHPQKYKDINAMSLALSSIMPKQYIYHYMPSKLKYLYHKVTAEEYKSAKLSDFKYEKFPAEQMARLYQKSDCILDAPQAGQTGLTMRTLECLGAKKKLITTNSDVKNYDFYREENIYIFDGSIDETNPFFTEPYRDLEADIYKKYSLRNWLGELLEA